MKTHLTKTLMSKALYVALILIFYSKTLFAQDSGELAFRPLFNGKNLNGWVDVNTSKETWKVKNGTLICSGKPIGVMRSDRQYENFILEVEWKHMEAGGNSGIFVWSEGTPQEHDPLTKAIEVQMLELDYAPQHNATEDYVHGELFPTMGMTALPDNPRGIRSKSLEKRCKGKGEWNKYVVVCVDGTVKLSVNGKFVNGLRNSERKKGYICLEAEGAEIHFRNMKIMELPGGITSPEQTAPLVD
ncbi:3-keto-disaccharide hydrolase [Dyadobacter sp.]|uniref:3-keto-disaccharide hydrolase n=1 Tax=Dyadobacter sp. TaxID=1914288 RepID=UPI003F720EE2